MMSSKRSLTSSKTGKQHTGKLKEMPTSSRTKEPKLPDLKDFTNVPVIKQMDNGRLLPKYTSILAKTIEEGVVMDDLDQLQHDLEKLLSTNALRTRFFLGEFTQADKDDKKTSMTAKRKKPDEKSKFKEVKGSIRGVKRDQFRPNELTYYKDAVEEIFPRNDSSDKFWASIEPYCALVGKDNVAFLDSLLQEFAKEIDTKIPEVGEHYSKLWSDELLGEEHSVGRPLKKPQDKKNGIHGLIESFGSVYTQRLLAATIQDKVLEVGESASNAEATGSTKNGEDCKTDENKTTKAPESTKPKPNSHKVGTCLDKRLLKELVEQGILTKEDVQQGLPEDELLKEIKKCQDELFTINEYNLDELNKLRSAVLNDIHCNQLKDDLDKVDKQLLDLYNTFMVAQEQAEGKDEQAFTDKIKTEFESKANALLRQQHVLNREINSMTDMSMLY